MKHIKYICSVIVMFAGNLYASWTTQNSPSTIMSIGIGKQVFSRGTFKHAITRNDDNSITFIKNGLTYKITPEMAQKILTERDILTQPKCMVIKPEGNGDSENRVVILINKASRLNGSGIEETGGYYTDEQSFLIATLPKEKVEGKSQYKYVVKSTCGTTPIEAKIDEVAACQFYFLQFLAFNKRLTGLTTNILAQDAAGKKYKMTIRIEHDPNPESNTKDTLSVVSATELPPDAPTSGFIISASEYEDPYTP